MATKYPVSTLDEMAAVPEQAWHRLASELPSMLAAHLAQIEFVKDNPELEMTAGGMIWVDDGERNCIFTATINETGETVELLKISRGPK